MVKNLLYTGSILKALKETPLSGKDLLKKSNSILEDEKDFRGSLESFTEALLELLDLKKVQIEEYKIDLDTSRERKQSFKPDGFIFSLVKTTPIELQYLINNVISGNDTKSYNNLRKRFKTKIDEMDDLNTHNWGLLIKKVEKRNPTDLELLWFIANRMTKKRMTLENKFFDVIGLDGFYCEVDHEMDKLESSKSRLVNKYNKTILIQLKIPKKVINDPYYFHIESFNPKPNSISENYKFTEENILKEVYLESLGYSKPDKNSYDDINNLYIQLISYINLQNSGKSILIDRLSMGLSEQEKSIKILDELINETTGKKIIDDTLFIK